MSKTVRRIVIIAVLLCFAALFTCDHHTCCGADCPICRLLRPRDLCVVFMAACLLAALPVSIAPLCRDGFALRIADRTPVSQKVKITS